MNTQPLTLEKFKATAQAINPIQVNRHTDGCDWVAGDGTPLMHERTTVPWSPFKPMMHHYWTNTLYTDKVLAEREAQESGGHVIEEFYCDPESPCWFMAFDDLDKALEFCFNKLATNKLV